MKKIIIFMIAIMATLFTTLAVASDAVVSNKVVKKENYETVNIKDENKAISTLFSSNNTKELLLSENIQVMSTENLADTKGGVTGPFVCIECNGRHGGVYSPYYCQWCFVKIYGKP